MKKILLILFLTIIAHAEFQNSGWVSSRDNGGDLQRTANHLANIENLLREQNKLLQQLVNKFDPPKPPPTAQESKKITEDYMSELKKANASLYERKLIFPQDGVTVENDEATKCIKECAEIYESTDKYEIKDCLMEMCGFSITDIYK